MATALADGPGSPDKGAARALLPMGRGQGIDYRAEEEAQRRALRSTVGNMRYAGDLSRARNTDLFGEAAFRQRWQKLGT